MRLNKDQYYIGIAQAVAMRGTCLRRNYGAVIVKDDVIISTGYTGAPRDLPNCCEIGTCQREKLKVPAGKRYDLCRSVHAEMNAIISPTRHDMLGGILYVAGLETQEDGTMIICNEPQMPCYLCIRMIYNAGIDEIRIPHNRASRDDMHGMILKNDYYDPKKQTELEL